MSSAIEFQNISKQYRLGLVSTGTIAHDLNRWWTMNVLHREDPYLKVGDTNDRSKKATSQYVWALKDINFSVEQGDVVGIIGKNGAGKSTLLKLLSRVTAPTTGTIRARGRIASLLEVGTGFHPEMTGRENIYMNGAILGMTKHEIDRKLDEIIDFSGCERYIDTPTKRYSSGMTVRLGFAIAAHLDPEILVVDEVLAVGDAEFQKKAIGKMQDVSKGQGRTVLFVSHNMNAVRNLCRRGVVLENGKLVYDSNVNDAVDHYLHKDKLEDNNTSKKITDGIARCVPYLQIHRIAIDGCINNHVIISCNQRFFELEIEGETDMELKTDVSLMIRNMDEVPLVSLNEGHFTGVLINIKPGKFLITKKVCLPKYLCRGECTIDISMHLPGISSFMSAPKSVFVSFEGNMGEFGRALDLKYNGLIGLETCK